MGQRIERFEDLIAWQKARALAARIYQVTSTEKFARDYKLSGQMRDASVSIMSNIAEGFERGRPKEFHQFLSIAKGSSGELRSQLYVALDAGYVERAVFQELFERTSEVGRVTGGLRASVQRRCQRV